VPDLETLRLVYADLVAERDRLRDARRDVTARLGPIPASAGIIIALFAALGPELEHGATALLFGMALIPFVIVMAISARALRRPSYRELVSDLQAARPAADCDSEEEWLTMMITFEREMYPRLADEFRQERSNLNRVQVLLGVQVVILTVLALVESYVT
jgi:hypothetical protein